MNASVALLVSRSFDLSVSHSCHQAPDDSAAPQRVCLPRKAVETPLTRNGCTEEPDQNPTNENKNRLHYEPQPGLFHLEEQGPMSQNPNPERVTELSPGLSRFSVLRDYPGYRPPSTIPSPPPGGPHIAKRSSLIGHLNRGGLGKSLGWERRSNHSLHMNTDCQNPSFIHIKFHGTKSHRNTRNALKPAVNSEFLPQYQ